MTPLTVMSTLAVELALKSALLPAWREAGRDVDMEWSPTGVLIDRVRSGERGDVLIAIDQPIAELVEQGVLRAGSVRPVARASFGLGVKRGEPLPDISTPERFEQALLSARSVAYSLTGASGIHFQDVIERLDIAEAVGAKATAIHAGFTADKVIAGEADLAVQQISELMSIDGIDVVGPVPGALPEAHGLLRGDLHRQRCSRSSPRSSWTISATTTAAEVYARSGLLARHRGGGVTPRIVLFHATPVAMDPVKAAMASLWPEAEAVNLLDDGLTIDRAKEGPDLSEELIERFVDFGRYAQRIGADGILITCSAFGPAIDRMEEELPLPILRPNEAMFREAIAAGDRIGMLATFAPSVATMEEEFRQFAAEAGADRHARHDRRAGCHRPAPAGRRGVTQPPGRRDGASVRRVRRHHARALLHLSGGGQRAERGRRAGPRRTGGRGHAYEEPWLAVARADRRDRGRLHRCERHRQHPRQGLPGRGLATSQYMGVPAAPLPRRSRPASSRSSPGRSRSRMRSPRRSRHCTGCRRRDAGSSSSSTARPSTRRPKATSGPSRRRWRTRSTSRASSSARPSRRRDAPSTRGISSSATVLLSESGMQNHPLTPMTDADIRRWLRLQTRSDVGHVPAPVVSGGAEAIGAALRARADRDETLAIVDAVADEDLVRIGRAVRGCAAPDRRVGHRARARRELHRRGAR